MPPELRKPRKKPAPQRGRKSKIFYIRNQATCSAVRPGQAAFFLALITDKFPAEQKDP